MLASHRPVTGSWRYVRVDGTSHWIPLDAPETLNKLLVEFISDS